MTAVPPIGAEPEEADDPDQTLAPRSLPALLVMAPVVAPVGEPAAAVAPAPAVLPAPTPAGQAPDHSQVLAALRQNPQTHGFFAAVRLIEAAHPDKPRLGHSRRRRDDPLRFGQEPTLAFATSTLASVRAGPQGVMQLLVHFMGMTGPNGPLPLHLTEFVRDRQRNQGDATLVDFLDVFHHRLLSRFYRAWAQAQPTVSLDRPGQDDFGRWIAALAGYGMDSLRQRDQVPDFAKLAQAGTLSRGVRHGEGLAMLLSQFFQVRAQVREWWPKWMRLPRDAQTRLGRDPATAGLGVTSVLGHKVWDCQGSFLVVLGPLSQAEFERLLPDGDSLARLRDWVLNYIGHELSCELQLVLKKEQVPVSRLGQRGKLGWTTWLGTRRSPTDADDLRLRLV